MLSSAPASACCQPDWPHDLPCLSCWVCFCDCLSFGLLPVPAPDAAACFPPGLACAGATHLLFHQQYRLQSPPWLHKLLHKRPCRWPRKYTSAGGTRLDSLSPQGVLGAKGGRVEIEGLSRQDHAQDHAQKEWNGPKQPCSRLPLCWCFAGGIRLDPSSASLWAGLGTCARKAHHQEYAFTRSLQLDPKSAHVWAALGRLYMESGARSLADTCFTQARSQDPADSATWAAMGALAGLSATGE